MIALRRTSSKSVRLERDDANRVMRCRSECLIRMVPPVVRRVINLNVELNG